VSDLSCCRTQHINCGTLCALFLGQLSHFLVDLLMAVNKLSLCNRFR
jgi:hypothetical protein